MSVCGSSPANAMRVVLLCCCDAQLAGTAGGSLVRGLAGLDTWLEGNKLLPELKPLEVPEAVQDENGQLNAECQEVRFLCLRTCGLCSRGWWL
jgi:hypothetical protein